MVLGKENNPFDVLSALQPSPNVVDVVKAQTSPQKRAPLGVRRNGSAPAGQGKGNTSSSSLLRSDASNEIGEVGEFQQLFHGRSSSASRGRDVKGLGSDLSVFTFPSCSDSKPEKSQMDPKKFEFTPLDDSPGALRGSSVQQRSAGSGARSNNTSNGPR